MVNRSLLLLDRFQAHCSNTRSRKKQSRSLDRLYLHLARVILGTNYPSSGSGDQNTPPLCFECAREMDPLRPCVELGCTNLCDTCCLLREVKFLWKNFDDVRRQDAENLNVQLRLAASSLRFAGLPLVLPPASASIARRATPQSIVSTTRPGHIVKMRPVPRGWSAIWDPLEGAHLYWQRDTGVTTWDLPLVHLLPKATLHPLMATATSTVPQDTGQQQPPGSSTTRHC